MPQERWVSGDSVIRETRGLTEAGIVNFSSLSFCLGTRYNVYKIRRFLFAVIIFDLGKTVDCKTNLENRKGKRYVIFFLSDFNSFFFFTAEG